MSELGDGIVVLPIHEYRSLQDKAEYRFRVIQVLREMRGLPGWFDEIELIKHLVSEYPGDIRDFYKKSTDAPVG